MAKNNDKPLRAVGYCRTSGEGQRDNTSIPRQRDAIESTCKREGWKLVRHYIDECKSGSTIAGREEFCRMMADAEVGAFDVAIPYDATRFSRDGCDLIYTARDWKKRLGVYVVDTKGQTDTRSYRNVLRNFVQAGVSEHERLTIMDRMIGGKIQRARTNVPTTGRLPWGRTFDRETGKWGIDADKQKLIRDIAERYVAGESLEALAAESPLSYSQLWKTLKRSCGKTWTVKYKVDDLELEDEIEHDVPELLPAALIRAVQRRMEANRTVRPGKTERNYILSGRVFCAGCGRAMTGAARPSGLRLYRHNPRSRDCPFSPRPAVRADLLEQAVVGDLFKVFGNVAVIEQVMKAAIPESDKANKRRSQIEKQLVRIRENRDRYCRMMELRALTESQAAAKLLALNNEESKLLAELESLSNQPTPAEIRRLAVRTYGEVHKLIQIEDDEGNTYNGGNDVQSYIMMTDDDRRMLIERVLCPLPGEVPGVFLTPDQSKAVGLHDPRRYSYVIRGGLVGEIESATEYRRSGRTPAVPR